LSSSTKPARRFISPPAPENICRLPPAHQTEISSRWRARGCDPIYALLHQAKQEGRRAARALIAVQVNGGVQMISLAVEPINEGNETAYRIVFIDRGPIETEHQSANSETPESNDIPVQQIEKELSETKERLQSTIEELETANEEFRSSNEELVSVNEELQSANEELETSKEELQSVNEELQTVNNELTSKIDELGRANSDLTNLFQTLRSRRCSSTGIS
jgi:two-component system CheB/CheR fusion protein